MTQISSNILARKKQPLEDYINYILSEGQPLDEIAICCFMRMYHIHIAVIMDSMFWTTCKDHDLQKCNKILGFIGSLSFISMKWKTQAEDTHVEQEPGPSGPSKTPDAPTSTYNLCPRKEQPTHHVTPEKLPEPEGYHLYSHAKKQSPKPKQKPSKPKSPKAKPVKFVMQSYGLRRPQPRVCNFNCIICQKKFDTQGHLNHHIMMDHPTFRFTCTYCNR